MATRTIWTVELGGGIDTQYSVLGNNPFQAAERGWRLDKDHQSHGQRVSMLVRVDQVFDDTENDIPVGSEDVLRAQVQALTARVAALEAAP
jgi:hypothetical protein